MNAQEARREARSRWDDSAVKKSAKRGTRKRRALPAKVNLEGLEEMELIPIQNGTIGREANGRFSTGNAGGPGNPYAKHTAALRRGLMEAVTLRDIQEIATKLLELAKGGDIDAARLLLDRVLGKPITPIILDDAVRHDPLGIRFDGGRERTVAEELAKSYGDPAYRAWRIERGLPADDPIPTATVGVPIRHFGDVLDWVSGEYQKFNEDRFLGAETGAGEPE